MKKLFKLSTLIIVILFNCCSSEPPTLCECLTTPGDLSSECKQVFENRYGTSDPSTDQMKSDYYNCK